LFVIRLLYSIQTEQTQKRYLENIKVFLVTITVRSRVINENSFRARQSCDKCGQDMTQPASKEVEKVSPKWRQFRRIWQERRNRWVLIGCVAVIGSIFGLIQLWDSDIEESAFVPPPPPASAMEALEEGSIFVASADSEEIETTQEGAKYVRGRLTVAFSFGTSAADVKALLEQYDLELVSWLADISVGEVKCKSVDDAEQHKQELLKESIVEEVQISTILGSEGEPIADDKLVEQFRYLNKIRARLGWEITKGRKEIRVAVIDSGIAEDHPDLKKNIFFTQHSINLYDDISCFDSKHHGTTVAGVIGASDGDGGISGVAPDVNLAIYKTPHDVVALAGAIIQATNVPGVRVINMSRGGYGPVNNNVGLRRAVDYAYERNVVLVASAGNGRKEFLTDKQSDGWEVFDSDDCWNCYWGVHYPSSYTKVLAVGNIDHNDKISRTSNYGDEVIYAPGEGIFTTYGANVYTSAGGTSVAAPQVSALAALILSIDNTLTNSEVIQIIKDTADDIEPKGLGRINVYRALTYASTGIDLGEDALPESPTNLEVEGRRDTEGRAVAQLTWAPPTKDYQGANIYRLRYGDNEEPDNQLEMLNDIPVTGNSYDDYTAEDGKCYDYYVYSVDSLGQESVFSAEETSWWANFPASTAPVINLFTAEPENIQAGDSTTLSWKVSNIVSGADTVVIEPDIGYVIGVGRKSVSPDTTTTYTLTATNAVGQEVQDTVTVTVSAAPPTTVESSTSNIAAFAENWQWSKERNQNGRYGETKVSLDLGGGTVTSATLYLTAAYSQQAGSANGIVYISSVQQVQPTDADHDHGNYWYGNSITAGIQAGTFTCSYSGSTSSFDITDFLSNNSGASTFYIAVENEATADIGVGTIYIEATVIP